MADGGRPSRWECARATAGCIGRSLSPSRAACNLAAGFIFLASCGGEDESRSATPAAAGRGRCDIAPYVRQLTPGVAVLAPIDPSPNPVAGEDRASAPALRRWLGLVHRFADAAGGQKVEAIGRISAEAPAAFAALRGIVPAAAAGSGEEEVTLEVAAGAWQSYADIIYADFLVSGDSARFVARMEALLRALPAADPGTQDSVGAIGRDRLADRGFAAALTSFALLTGKLDLADRAYEAMIADSLAPPASGARLTSLRRHSDPVFHRYVAASGELGPCELRIFMALQDLAFWSMRFRASGEEGDAAAALRLEELVSAEVEASPELAPLAVLADYWRQYRRPRGGMPDDRVSLDSDFWRRAQGVDAPLLVRGACARSSEAGNPPKGLCP